MGAVSVIRCGINRFVVDVVVVNFYDFVDCFFFLKRHKREPYKRLTSKRHQLATEIDENPAIFIKQRHNGKTAIY